MASLIVIFDEFDRIKNTEVITAMADTIKALSDNSVNATILLIGVANSVNEFIREHQSIERALVQIPMPRMSDHEIRTIVDKGLARLTMAIDDTAREDLVLFSQGVPYIAHLLCIYTCRAALASGRKTIFPSHVEQGMNRSLDQWQQSIKALYNEAVQSPRPGHIYKEVLLACALAEVDDLRFFTTAAVKRPLSKITDREFKPIQLRPSLEGPQRTGARPHSSACGKNCSACAIASQIRFLRPYIIMRGVKDKLITKDQILEAEKRSGRTRRSRPACPAGVPAGFVKRGSSRLDVGRPSALDCFVAIACRKTAQHDRKRLIQVGRNRPPLRRARSRPRDHSLRDWTGVRP